MTHLNQNSTLTIHSITECDNSYRVVYSTDGCDVTLTLLKSTLCQFIIDAGLNVMERYNQEMTDVDWDYLEPKVVLENETGMVVRMFVEENS